MCRFQLLNHRADMRFVLVTNLSSWLGGYDVLAKAHSSGPRTTMSLCRGTLLAQGTPGRSLLFPIAFFQIKQRICCCPW